MILNKRMLPIVVLSVGAMLVYVLFIGLMPNGGPSAAVQTPTAPAFPLKDTADATAVEWIGAEATTVPVTAEPQPGEQGSAEVVRTFPAPPLVQTPAPIAWVVVAEDDFSDPSKMAWPVIKSSGMTSKYYSNSFQMFVRTPGQMGFVSKEVGESNVKIDVDAQFAIGSRLNYYGVMCRFANRKNFYYFTISNGGAFAVGKVVDGVKVSLLNDEFLPAEVVKRERNEVNHLSVICSGSDLYFYINDTLMSSIADTSLTGGTRIGFIAASEDAGGSNFFFDNLQVQKPQ